MIFSGQGLYNLHILQLLMKKYSLIKQTFYEASEFLKYDILKKIFNVNYPNQKYQLDFQYLLLISSVALFRLWLQESLYIYPDIIAGHSLGQYSALICNNSIKFIDGLKILKIRNQIIQSNIKNISFLTYAIIGLKLETIKKICLYVSKNQSKVFVSCINSDIQIVITGHDQAVLKARTLCKKYGAIYTIKLPIYISMHCNLMRKISKIFSYNLNDIKISLGKCSIIENVNASFLLSRRDIYSAIIKQFYRPVKWNKIIKKIKSNNIQYCIEINLKNSLRNICILSKNIKILSINSPNSLISTIDIIKK
ncbi:malonyl CoA-acyl carrier protein transacylase [Buchnera aphidicola (Cinara tujafilina)]|uniref:Malonyl CoA-acyl carrier protein transacylase n=1 Tax=Buchnera aphidicola (Cinara tujafilina) TaxID=261317 RepID=F7WZE8_9GAMM|nr:malonyl CoA-acyl carrier protein transacylase [Buchnera aphidicola (Cinara tujafilina)]